MGEIPYPVKFKGEVEMENFDNLDQLFEEWWIKRKVNPDDQRNWSLKDEELSLLASQIADVVKFESKKAFMAGYNCAKGGL